GSLGGFGSNYNELVFNKAAIYPTPTRTLTPTVGPSPTATPFPRPNVGVQAVPHSGSALQVPITARDAGCSQGNNQLLSLQFTRLDNATVDVPVIPSVTLSAPGTVSIPSRQPT